MKNGSSSSPESTHTLDKLFGAMPDAAARASLRKFRATKDVSAKYFISASGMGVVFALALIFIFLFIELVPIFAPAKIEKNTAYIVPGGPEERTLLLDMDRYQEVGVRYRGNGEVLFFELATGMPMEKVFLPVPEGVEIRSFGKGEPRSNLVVFGLSDGTAILVRHEFELDWTGNVRTIVPTLTFPFGRDPVPVDPMNRPLRHIAVQRAAAGTAVATVTDDDRVLLVQLATRTSFLTGETVVTTTEHDLGPAPGEVVDVLISSNMINLFLADANGKLHYYDLRQPSQAGPAHSLEVVPDASVSITAVDFLLGTVSLVVGRSDGSISQYFLVRDHKNRYFITHVRDFESHSAPITILATEYTRKGFAAADSAGVVGLHYPTSERTLLLKPITDSPVHVLAFSPTNSALLALDDTQTVHLLDVDNPHPEYSFSALWQKVWYEGRAAPDYVWQSSSASDEFESKFSQMPLTLGTLKASFYAMLIAMPLSVLGAIYAAYFMSPKLRSIVKPSIEVMEALPTVILGFLAGLWLAPFVESNLPAVFSIVVFMPLMMLLAAFLWSSLPHRIRLLVPDGWEAAMLVPIILVFGWVCVTLSPHIEIWFFDGSARQWLTDVGITYDQRNALVVGLAMGFAVIPTIFSIAEDAIFNVPKHLTQGSLALGATPWQTVTRVVLLTASPGIFSAIMIGFGRAVGETMIVLMATGNSPVMNFNIFEGMRTLSANIAVELPETAVGSTHYRILFLAALVLFVLTFIVNTVAEIVRQRLRKKYSSL
ncbi:phosphate transport system permease protein [Desulfonatronum thiosulfatophilum]|uniref:Phosphate transport system permease protein n=1 Tax=Desulfonatronum thiosulfatophilum TaxID=617002 RepID=A0A1G6DJ23_9BACT|nr:ABC transporter permease subunit [Desulfonatronum thiosulfatophilum]SDB45184.1 phosphate transport system permease protein [Desulfonatronum thiosulfatophilum]